MNINRRLFMKASVFTGAFISLLGSGRLFASWPTAAFEAKTEADAIKAALGTDQLIDSDQITIKVPPIAENGQTVPITVTTSIADAEVIRIFAVNNPYPLSATFTLSAHTEPTVATKIKLAKTGDVLAVVQSKGQYYVKRQPVKVTKGGCGG